MTWFLWALALLLIAFKLLGYVTASWFLVLTPIWVLLVLYIAIIALTIWVND